MKKKEYIILLIALISIIAIFSFFYKMDIILFLSIIILIIFIISYVLYILGKGKSKLNKYNNCEINIYSWCYINDDINFFKLYSLICKRNNSDNLEKITSNDFINLLIDKKLAISLKEDYDILEIITQINLLLAENNISMKLTDDDISSYNQNKNKLLTFIYILNIITKMIRSFNYELVEIYPIQNKKKKILKHYFILVPINKLLDLNEIGYMG